MPNWISLTTVWFLQNLDQDYITPQALSSLFGHDGQFGGDPDAGYRFVNRTGHVGTVADVNATNITIIMNASYSITANFVIKPQYHPLVAVGGYDTVGLRADGTVVAVGDNSWGQGNVGG